MHCDERCDDDDDDEDGARKLNATKRIRTLNESFCAESSFVFYICSKAVIAERIVSIITMY